MTLTFDEAADLYMAEIKDQCEPCSYNHYRKGLKPFRVEFGSMLLTEISKDYVLMLIDALNHFPDGSEKAPDTIRSNVQRWEQLQTWLLDEEILESPITKKKIKKPAGRMRNELPTIDETRQILAVAEEKFSWFYRSLRMTGARPNELAKAQIEEYDRHASVIRLEKHKTSKKVRRVRRIAVGHPALIEIVNQSIDGRSTGHIFRQRTGTPWRTEYASRDFRTIRDRLGLRKCLVLYLTRHEHATELYRVRDDVKAVMDALGHANVQTTMRYAHAQEGKLKQNQQLFDEGLGSVVPANTDDALKQINALLDKRIAELVVAGGNPGLDQAAIVAQRMELQRLDGLLSQLVRSE